MILSRIIFGTGFFLNKYTNIFLCNYLYINLRIEKKNDYLLLKNNQMEKTIYSVMYFGNAKRYQDLCEEVAAYSKRHAVEKVYAKMCNEDYFPEDDFLWGAIVRDCDGNVIAERGSETIEYDGGYFYAEPVTL